MREGSAALGASSGYMLRRITIPWAMPNIVTSVLLGCAEAAGSVTVLLLIAGSGARGVGAFTESTSLAFSIFYAQVSPSKPYRDATYQYQFAAALALLALALAITLVALLFKHRYAARYRGA
jgi:ABC-type phosphate transport system permease subunit